MADARLQGRSLYRSQSLCSEGSIGNGTLAGLGSARSVAWALTLGVVLALVGGGGVQAEIIEVSNPTAVTHWLSSGDTHFGINSLGGGYVSCVLQGGVVARPDQCPSSFGDDNIVSVGYGRGWQMAIRDQLHKGRHNPTQAGFRDSAGAPSEVSEGASCSGPGGRVFVAPFTLPIYSNAKNDWVENEDLVPDNFSDDGGNSDQDSIDESTLSQADEITSEWVYSALYEDASDRVTADVAIVRHLAQADYRHVPDAIYQFGEQALMIDGSSVINPKGAEWLDIAPDASAPAELQGPQIAAHDDYGTSIYSYIARARYSLGYHTMLWIDEAGQWQEELVTECDNLASLQLYGDQHLELFDGNPNSLLGGNPAGFSGMTDRPLIIRSTGGLDELDTAMAVGAYLPPTACNTKQTVGIETASGDVVYAQDRRVRYTLIANRRACGAEPGVSETKLMGVPGEEVTVENDHTSFGLRFYSLGVLSPEKGVPGVHERMRLELYLFAGTPSAIRAAVEEMEASGLLDQGDCEVAPTCQEPPHTVPTLGHSGSVALILCLMGSIRIARSWRTSRMGSSRPHHAPQKIDTVE